MKKIMILAAGLMAVAASYGAAKEIPLMIAVPEQAEYVPQIAREALANKMRQIVSQNGMSSTADAGQFFLTCVLSVQEKQILGGAPVKVAQKVDVSFYVADAFNEKVFGTASVSVRGVGNGETKAMMAAVQQISPSAPALRALITESNAKILAYYQAQCPTILLKARTMAKAHSYGEAFFQLSLIPEQCDCYPEVLAAAGELYQEYNNYLAEANLAKARSIWAAGMTREAAAEAVEYLAQIMPDAKCYPQAQALLKEIQSRVKEDIGFDRKQLEWKQKNTQDIIHGWRAIGVAYGNNQKSVNYSPVWVVR